MKRYKFTLALVGCLVLGVTAIAQQEPPVKKRIPVLTSEDLTRSQGRSGQTVILSAAEPTEWTKFTPGVFRLSMELPGGLEPMEIALPDIVLNEFHREYGDAKYYIGGSNGLALTMLYLPSKKASVTSTELKSTAEKFLRQMTLAIDHNATYTTQVTGKSKVSIKASITAGPEPLEMLGTMQSRGKEIWLVTSVFQRSDDTARKIALRVIGSTTLY